MLNRWVLTKSDASPPPPLLPPRGPPLRKNMGQLIVDRVGVVKIVLIV
jgi:hypothetical protein